MSHYWMFSLIACSVLTVDLSATDERAPVVEQIAVEQDPAELLQQSRTYIGELTHHDHVVMEKFDAFSETLLVAYSKEKSMTSADVHQVCKAMKFAADKHRFQTRKNKEKTPYISHPIGVANNVMAIGKVRDSAIIMGALLHDTLEDTQTTEQELQEHFGAVVTGYVKEVTDDTSLPQEVRKRLQVVNASHKSAGAAQIKLADKLYNLNDLLQATPEGWSQARIDQYFEWTQSIVDRLPQVNPELRSAVDTVANTYWDKQVEAVKAAK